MTCIALVGDFDDSVPAHRAIPVALALAASHAAASVSHQWLPTTSIHGDGALDGVNLPPVVAAFVAACVSHAAGRNDERPRG